MEMTLVWWSFMLMLRFVEFRRVVSSRGRFVFIVTTVYHGPQDPEAEAPNLLSLDRW